MDLGGVGVAELANASVLPPYVPRLVTDWAVTQTNDPFRPIPGTMVFADLSGFTAMSERLSRHGRVGAEEVTDAIGACFAELLAVAYDAGGGLLKFGGDATSGHRRAVERFSTQRMLEEIQALYRSLIR